MPNVYIDFETRSEVDIRKAGAAVYAEHVSTDYLCIAYAIDDEPIKLIAPVYLHSDELERLAENPNYIFIAHNSAFEQNIWLNVMVKKHGYPRIPIERWKCTMAKCFAHSLPGALERAAKALNLGVEKDMEGNRIMQKLSKPRRQTKNNTNKWWNYNDVPDQFERLYAYCKQDVEVERMIDKALRDLSPKEQKLWVIDQHMNQRGIKIDTKMVYRALRFADTHEEKLSSAFYNATGGKVESPSKRAQFEKWCKDEGYAIPNTQASTIKAILAKTDVPDHVRNAITLFAQAGKSSLAKYPAFVQRSNNGVVKEILQYHGAHTGRWSGRGVQLQNMPRPKVDIDKCVDVLTNYDDDTFYLLYGDPNTALSSIIRGVIVARPNHDLYVADYGQIESRGLAWLAGETSKLEAFERGEDVYCNIASYTFGRPIGKHDKERQVGKVEDLSLGYAGGINAFAKMAKNYELDLSPLPALILPTANSKEIETAEFCYMLYLKTKPEEPVSRKVGYACDIIKQRFRVAHPNIVQYWFDLEQSAIKAVQTGKVVKCRNLLWFMHDRFLFCKLPSGRVIAYPYPKLEQGSKGKITLTYKYEYNKMWIRGATYGGSLSENITQAVCRDVLADAMIRLDENGYPILLTVHDEIVCEVPTGMGYFNEFYNMLVEQPEWAQGFPIKAEGWVSKRYGKR